MEDLKVKVNNETESKEAQELFFELGVSWFEGKYLNENIPCDRSIILHNFGSQLFWSHIYENKNFGDAKEITLPELRSMVFVDEPFFTPECTLNDQYAEIEQIRQDLKGVESTLAQRQSEYGSFEDVAFVTENIMSILAKVRVNGLQDLPNTHRMALYMIASKMARIVNGDFNKLDSWHDIGGYSKLIENLIDGK